MTKLTDRQLADLTAEHVMGWNKDEYYWASEDGVHQGDWNPCNDWNDMRLVIEKIGFWRIEFIYHLGSVEVKFRTSEREGRVKAESIGRAVCFAALKAKGVEL